MNPRDRTDREDIEEIGLSLYKLQKLFELLSCFSGADQSILRTDDVAEVFGLLSDYMSVIRGDVEAVIDRECEMARKEKESDR